MSGGGPDQRRPHQPEAGSGSERLGASDHTDSLFGGHFSDQLPTAELTVDQIMSSGQEPHGSSRPPQQNQPITGSVPVVVIPRSQRYLELAHRWRSLLGFALAAAITGAAVVAYQSAADSRGAIDLEATASEVTIAPGAAGDGSDPDGPATSESSTPASESNDPAVASEAEQMAGAEAQTPRPTTTVPEPSSSVASDDEDASDSSTSTTESEATTSSTEPEATTMPAEESTTTMGSAPTKIRVEAESGVVTGTARVRADHAGFSGTGFVGDIITPDSSVAITIDSPTAGPTPFSFRYSAGPTTPDGQPTPDGQRTLTVLVNGQVLSEAQMRQTTSWDEWDVITGELTLDAGPNIVTFALNPGNTGWANIDYIEIN